MLLKSRDDKSEQIEQLEALLSASTTKRDRRKIEDELRILRAGLKAEKNSEHLINFNYMHKNNMAVIHDLRIEVNGRIAQIDHILINRALDVFVLETKGFHAGLKINEQGEFLRWNDWKKKYEGMPSPISQNERHIAVLKEAFEQIEMPVRMGFALSPTFHSIILVDNHARIDRPKGVDTSSVIKSDMLSQYLQNLLDKESAIAALGSLSKVIWPETLEKIGRDLVGLHRPFSINYRAKFGMVEDADTVIPNSETEQVAANSNATTSSGSDHTYRCERCGSSNLVVQYGFSYYFK